LTKISSIPLLIALLIPPLAVAGSSAYAQTVATDVPAGIHLSKDLGRVDPSTEINITVHLNLSDKAAFDNAVDALYDPASPTFHKWMTNADLKKYAPTEAQRSSVRQELEAHGLKILSTDRLGFMIRAHGTIANVESAFNTEIHQFEHNGLTFRANVRDIRLTGEAGNYVYSVAGIESHQMRPLAVQAVNLRTQQPLPSVEIDKTVKAAGFPAGSTPNPLSAPETLTMPGTNGVSASYGGTVYLLDDSLIADFLPNQLETALGLNEVYAAGYDGSGETIALIEGYGYPTLEQDANTFATLGNLPPFTKSNFTMIYPEGKPNPELGIETGWNIEIALDIDSAHAVAPGANILEVITSGQDSEDFQTSISYVTEYDLANSLSNSYEEDLDLIAGRDEQVSWDDVLEIASAKGISVNFSSGDSGDNGLGTPVGAPGVPSDAPHATSVGGTSILNDVNNPGSTITTSWGDTLTNVEADPGTVYDPPSVVGLYAGGGGGESVFWKKPAWQSSLPGTGRQTPDVSALADPFTGVPIVVTVGKKQEVQFGWGGTSLACPIFSAFWAIANEKEGKPLGQAARAIAGLPYGGVQDVLPTTDSTPNDVTGSITDQNGTTNYSASALFAGAIYGNKGFTSALWQPTPGDPTTVIVFGFGIDSSLTVRHGWDNATGWGTPYGLTFINAVTAPKK
jgi:subtilase family serine protease